MKRKFTPLLISMCLLAGACGQMQEKLTALRIKGKYRSKGNVMEITDKKIILSDADTTVHMKMLFNYEVVGKRLVLEPASSGGLGGLVMMFGVTPELKIISGDSIRYKANTVIKLFERVKK